jgi:hypothetical protein
MVIRLSQSAPFALDPDPFVHPAKDVFRDPVDQS